LMFLTKGVFPGDHKRRPETDSEKPRTRKETTVYELASNKNTLQKTEAVYLSGNKTRDDIPPHLKVKEDLPEDIQEFYTHLCPAGVYERKNGKLIVNAPNCVDCKATDVLGPGWTPKEGGAGPNYTQM